VPTEPVPERPAPSEERLGGPVADDAMAETGAAEEASVDAADATEDGSDPDENGRA